MRERRKQQIDIFLAAYTAVNTVSIGTDGPPVFLAAYTAVNGVGRHP